MRTAKIDKRVVITGSPIHLRVDPKKEDQVKSLIRQHKYRVCVRVRVRGRNIISELNRDITCVNEIASHRYSIIISGTVRVQMTEYPHNTKIASTKNIFALSDLR